jgi:hypothetical protein
MNSVVGMSERPNVLRGLEAKQAPGLALYAITLALELAGAFARGLITFLPLTLCQLLTGWPIPVQLLTDVVAPISWVLRSKRV